MFMLFKSNWGLVKVVNESRIKLLIYFFDVGGLIIINFWLARLVVSLMLLPISFLGIELIHLVFLFLFGYQVGNYKNPFLFRIRIPDNYFFETLLTL